MNEIKTKFTDGTEAIATGDKVIVKEIGANQEWKLKTIDENGVVETIPFIGGRPDDR